MLERLHTWLLHQSARTLDGVLVLLISAISITDHFVGYELSLAIFYVAPVAVASWYRGTLMGILVSLSCSAVWLGAELTSGREYTSLFMPIWNTGVRLSVFVVIVLLLRRLHQALQLQQSLAQNDGLTGITNARSFKEKYPLLASLAIRDRSAVALGYIDVDGFKGMNDRFGHSVGDEVLITIAHELRERMRTSDVVARLGGDEFAVLLTRTDAAGATAIFTQLQTRLLRVADEHRWPIGFSIGVAVFQPPPSDCDQAIAQADALMYRVKKSGKNRLLVEEYAEPASL